MIFSDTNNNYTLTLGQEDEIRLSIAVDNLGESAYDSQLFVQHDSSFHYIAADITVSIVINFKHRKCPKVPYHISS